MKGVLVLKITIFNSFNSLTEMSFLTDENSQRKANAETK